MVSDLNRVRRKKIAVIGPNTSLCSKELFDFGVELGQAISSPERIIVCGGMGGFMEAVCMGAKKNPLHQQSLTVGILPGEDSSEANPYVDIAIPTGIGIARNIIIINTAEIIIAAGGGAGTLSELAFAWQKGKKVLCVTSFGGWALQLAGVNIDERNVEPFVAVSDVGEIVHFLEKLGF